MKETLRALEAQREGLNRTYKDLRKQVEAVPADAEGFAPIRSKFFMSEQARSLMDMGVPLMGQRLEAALTSGKQEQLAQVWADLGKATAEMRQLNQLSVALMHEIAPYTRMLEYGQKLDASMTFVRALPTGAELKGSRGGVEERVLELVEAPQAKLPKTWFELDRLAFESGAELDPRSKDQLQNLSEILKAYPKVKLKLGGYTADSGIDPAQRKLATERAEAIQAELVQRGVLAERLDATVTGGDFPTCVVRAAEKCDGKSERAALRVTAK